MPLTKVVIDTITGVKATSRVAKLTFAAKAIGRIPNPTLAGPSKLIFKAIKYRIVKTKVTILRIIPSGKVNSLRFSSVRLL